MPLRPALFAVAFAITAPASLWAQDSEKEAQCRLQGELLGTIQKARLDGVRKAKLQEAVAAARPDFSANVLATVPQLGEYVYGLRRRDLRKVDLNAVTRQQCLQQWDQIQALQKSVTN